MRLITQSNTCSLKFSFHTNVTKICGKILYLLGDQIFLLFGYFFMDVLVEDMKTVLLLLDGVYFY